MVSHFMFESDFCNPAAGWEKGQIEKNVRDARYRLWHDAPAFRDLAALNTWLEQRCKALWQEIRHPEQTDRTIAEVYADEQSALMAVPPPFDGFIEHAKRVSPTCLIVFERNRYSVPAALANQVISLRVYADRLVMVARAEVIAEQAVREAIDSGVLTKTHILNRLGHLLDEPRPARLEPPPALAINAEPVANTDRYDHLREVHHVD